MRATCLRVCNDCLPPHPRNLLCQSPGNTKGEARPSSVEDGLVLKPGDALSRLLVGTSAKLDRNMFCFILSNSFTHTCTRAAHHTDIHTEATFRHTYTRGIFSALLLKALTASLTYLLLEGFELLETSAVFVEWMKWEVMEAA